MLEKLLTYEREAFFLFNGSDYPFLDRIMWLYSGKFVWVPLAIFILVLLLYKKKWWECLLIILAIVLVITLCDQFASHVCKPLFTRFRPTHHPDFMDQVKIVFGYRGGRYGFISSHAANAFGFATLMALFLKNRLFTCTIFFWAILMSYTRIYLGVHFISDIVPGAIIGCMFGYLTYLIFAKAHHYFSRRELQLQGNQAICSSRITTTMIMGILITLFTILIFNGPLLTVLG